MPNTDERAQAAANVLHARGAAHVIIKRGAQGAYWSHAEHAEHFQQYPLWSLTRLLLVIVTMVHSHVRWHVANPCRRPCDMRQQQQQSQSHAAAHSVLCPLLQKSMRSPITLRNHDSVLLQHATGRYASVERMQVTAESQTGLHGVVGAASRNRATRPVCGRTIPRRSAISPTNRHNALKTNHTDISRGSARRLRGGSPIRFIDR
jgi:hypothetical protein